MAAAVSEGWKPLLSCGQNSFTPRAGALCLPGHIVQRALQCHRPGAFDASSGRQLVAVKLDVEQRWANYNWSEIPPQWNISAGSWEAISVLHINRRLQHRLKLSPVLAEHVYASISEREPRFLNILVQAEWLGLHSLWRPLQALRFSVTQPRRSHPDQAGWAASLFLDAQQRSLTQH